MCIEWTTHFPLYSEGGTEKFTMHSRELYQIGNGKLSFAPELRYRFTFKISFVNIGEIRQEVYFTAEYTIFLVAYINLNEIKI